MEAKSISKRIFLSLLYFTFLAFVLHFSFCTLRLLQPVQAATMSSPNYNLQKKDIEVGPPNTPTPTPTKEPEKPYATGTNYTVQTNAPSAFTFSVSLNELNFGKPTATNPIIRLLFLTATSKSPYQVLSAADHQLMSGDKTIPDTTCDNGSCNQETSSSWVSALTYGFGYSAQNMPEDNYKQFPDLSKNEPLEAVFSHESANNKQDKVVYKVNVSSTQQVGTYSNVVTYIAVPSY